MTRSSRTDHWNRSILRDGHRNSWYRKLYNVSSK